MIYFLDTNICIYFLKGLYPAIRTRMLARRPAEIAIPAIVKAELPYGAYKSQRREENEQAIARFLLPFAVAHFGDAEAEEYAGIRATLEQAGTPIGPNDMIIAATVRANAGVLVTHNISEFSRVPDLVTEDWTVDSEVEST